MVDKSNIVNREEYFMGESRQLKLEHLDIGSFVKQGWLFALTVALWDKKKKRIKILILPKGAKSANQGNQLVVVEHQIFMC